MSFYNPPGALGVATATSLALGGATIGADALAVTGTASFGGAILVGDAANVLAQRNGGTNLSAVPQTFRVYNYYTDASNYERASLSWSANLFTVSSGEAAGTGTSRDMSLLGGGTSFSIASGGITASRNGTSNGTTFTVSGTSLTSLAQLFVRLTPTINQASGTYSVLDINPTETAVGAGPHFLIKGRLGAGINVFGVKNDGSIQSGDPTNGVQFKNNGGVEAVFTRADGTTAILVKSGQFRATGGTLATAGSASGAGAGAITYVSDATATTPRSIAAGGGANKVMVWSDGTNWLIF